MKCLHESTHSTCHKKTKEPKRGREKEADCIGRQEEILMEEHKQKEREAETRR